MIETDRLIAAATSSTQEEVLERALRPKYLEEYVGQEKIREQLEIFIQAARNRREALDHVLLFGPPGLGKTTLALDIADTIPSVYLDLENRFDLQKAHNIEAFHKANSDKLIILDEVQRLPDIFAPIRGLIDQQRRKGSKVGQFLFLGSASIDLL